MMKAEFHDIFVALKPLLKKFEKRLSVKKDSATEYTLVTKTPSPFPQHRGEPLFFGSVRLGKAYVSYHLMPLYMCPVLQKKISPTLKKRMQGKSCFNFKGIPESQLTSELKSLTEAALKVWSDNRWL